MDDAKPMVLTLDPEIELSDVAPIKTIAAPTGPIYLPIIGVVPTPKALMIRADGHVAWVGQAGTDGLHSALAKWC